MKGFKMGDYIGEINEYLENGNDVIFYAVGGATLLNLRELNYRFNKLPTAICDIDIKKQGKKYRHFYDLEVQDPKELMNKYPSAKWLICSTKYRYQIIDFLLENNIDKINIINYVEVQKYRSCHELQEMVLYTQDGDIGFCCSNTDKSLISKDEQNKVVGNRNKYIDKIKNNENNDYFCKNCDSIKEDFFPKKPFVQTLNYFAHNICNFKCTYCFLEDYDERNKRITEEQKSALEILNIIETEEKNEEKMKIVFTAGEPTLFKKRKEIYSLRNYNLEIATNGSIFDEDLFNEMDMRQVHLNVSLDSGTKETYKKIKQVDCFEKTVSNLKKYSKAKVGILDLKYIFIPDINDNIYDVDGFIELCKEINPGFVILSLDYFTLNKITENTISMMNRMRDSLEDLNVLYINHTANVSENFIKQIDSSVQSK